MAAILSPGIGYMAGYGLERGVRWFAEGSEGRARKAQTRRLEELDQVIIRLGEELLGAQGRKSEIARLGQGEKLLESAEAQIEFINTSIQKAYQEKYDLLSNPIAGGSTKIIGRSMYRA
jgi:hypothetical protein